MKYVFDEYIEKYSYLIDKSINRVSLKYMNTRWGSCNYKKGYINLNINLIHKNKEFIEYVVFHELVHLLYPNHGKDFYAFIYKYMPDYKMRIRQSLDL
jgi:predicted metal-dependent hydrolase